MFGPKTWIWATLAVSSVPTLAARAPWNLGNGFELTVDSDANHLSVSRGNIPFWETIPGKPFLGASAGIDNVVGANGNFKITDVDDDKCTTQHIHRVAQSAWAESLNHKAAVVQGTLSGCGDDTVGFSFAIWVPSSLPDRIAFRINVNPGSSSNPSTKVFLTYRSSESEDFYGFGGQGSFASLKNQSVPIFSREQGVGRGDQPTTRLESEDSFFAGGDQFTTYSAVPQYISSKARVFHLSEDSTAYTKFDFESPEAVTVRYAALNVEGYLMQAENMLHGITMLTEYTGRMAELPQWVDTGAVMGIQGGQEKVNRIVDQGLRQNCPIAGVWLQDWSGTHKQSASFFSGEISRLWWNWESDEKLYPTWNKFVQNLRDEHNVRTLSYVNPFLANVSTKPDGYRRNMFLEATKGGYMIQNATTNSTSIVSSGPGIDAGILDLTNPEARAWFRGILTDQVFSANISGYMCDFGEYTPVLPDTQFYNKSIDPLFYHNQYPRDWPKLHHSLINSVSSFKDSILFQRSSALGSQRYMNLYWAGDQDTNWGVNDGIKSSVTVMGHMGLSGFPHGHVEIGGYTTTWTDAGTVNRTAELLGRWGELSAVSSAVFRSHEGNVPQLNAQFYTNATTYAYYAYNARMFRSLAAYRRRILDTESKNLSWPLLRMPVIYHPDDAKAKSISYESFYLGSDLYVAPVLDQGRTSVEVYLPGKETFTHVWSGQKYQGGQTIQVAAPYGKPAVFVVGQPKHDDLKDFLEFTRKENGTVIRV
ncbi:hypothetical protein N7532_009816 [Penicillium argentinense]|uniref:Alpha-glucosidase n=1 Tax=Penicillium argentinense TaxID=1131581 RepID=A0A9W9ENM7_9EURO|nr:uncharacterized protein N7532_009816 [Penicillium argentinense]KAJ5085045.1 hypothetical protein N7532_009816 [Penicillium argentinense]